MDGANQYNTQQQQQPQQQQQQQWPIINTSVAPPTVTTYDSISPQQLISNPCTPLVSPGNNLQQQQQQQHRASSLANPMVLNTQTSVR